MSGPSIQFHEIWIEQCRATEDIRERCGLEDAIRYLIGGKTVRLRSRFGRRSRLREGVARVRG